MVSTPLKDISQLGSLFPIYISIYEKKCSRPPTSKKLSLKCSFKDLHQKIEALQIEFLPFWVVFSAIPPLEHLENQQAITRHNLTAAEDGSFHHYGWVLDISCSRLLDGFVQEQTIPGTKLPQNDVKNHATPCELVVIQGYQTCGPHDWCGCGVCERYQSVSMIRRKPLPGKQWYLLYILLSFWRVPEQSLRTLSGTMAS